MNIGRSNENWTLQIPLVGLGKNIQNSHLLLRDTFRTSDSGQMKDLDHTALFLLKMMV